MHGGGERKDTHESGAMSEQQTVHSPPPSPLTHNWQRAVDAEILT
jgi:hypothetical protein